jgi:molybdopterin adenylyltransferase
MACFNSESGMGITTGIIIISDRCARGQMQDASGPTLRAAAEIQGWKVLTENLVPDDKAEIQKAIRQQIQAGCQLILTTGGTGIAEQDVTPEAVREIALRELSGFGEVMRMESRRMTPWAILSRNLAAVVEKSLVICLPGKPTGAVECLGFVAEAIPHAVALLQGQTGH